MYSSPIPGGPGTYFEDDDDLETELLVLVAALAEGMLHSSPPSPYLSELPQLLPQLLLQLCPPLLQLAPLPPPSPLPLQLCPPPSPLLPSLVLEPLALLLSLFEPPPLFCERLFPSESGHLTLTSPLTSFTAEAESPFGGARKWPPLFELAEEEEEEEEEEEDDKDLEDEVTLSPPPTLLG